GHKTLFFYNADGQLTQTINALGEVQESVYNALGQVAQTIAYGTRLSGTVLAPLAGGLVNATLTSALAAIRNPALDSVTSYAYTARGELASTVDALGFATTRSYDAFGDVAAESQAIAAGSTQDQKSAYDRRGLRTQTVSDPLGIANTETTTYDAFGRAIRVTDARGGVTTRSYDRLGRTVTITVPVTDALSRTATTACDAFDRVLTQTDALGKSTTYRYDTANRTITVTTPEGVV